MTNKDKKFKLKISDIIFYIFIILALIPKTRVFIIRGVTELGIMQPSVKKTKVSLQTEEWNWKLVDTNNKIISLSDFKGKVIIINFWATWCPPCVAELPSLHKLYRTFSNTNNVAFIFVTNDDIQQAHEFLQHKEMKDLPIYTPASYIPISLQSKSIPATFIIDKDGNIVVDKKGAANWSSKKIIELIDSLNNNITN